MYRAALALWLAVELAGCSHAPEAGQPATDSNGASPGAAGCAQARWQAQTAPVINKRQGQDALDNYDPDGGEGAKPCP
jgi:hypothetical protein